MNKYGISLTNKDTLCVGTELTVDELIISLQKYNYISFDLLIESRFKNGDNEIAFTKIVLKSSEITSIDYCELDESEDINE
jgi:hypothetical protein